MLFVTGTSSTPATSSCHCSPRSVSSILTDFLLITASAPFHSYLFTTWEFIYIEGAWIYGLVRLQVPPLQALDFICEEISWNIHLTQNSNKGEEPDEQRESDCTDQESCKIHAQGKILTPLSRDGRQGKDDRATEWDGREMKRNG